MNRLKKFAVIAMLGCTMLMPALTTAASIITSEQTSAAGTAGLGDTPLETIIFQGIQLVLGLLAIIVLVLIIYAGIMWMTAAGSEEKVQKAQGIIKNAIIGLLIIMASWGIVVYLADIFSDATGTGVTESSSGGTD